MFPLIVFFSLDLGISWCLVVGSCGPSNVHVVEGVDCIVDDPTDGLLHLVEGVEACLFHLLNAGANPFPVKVEGIVNASQDASDAHDDDKPGEVLAVIREVPYHEKEEVDLAEGGKVGNDPLVWGFMVVGEDVVKGDWERGGEERVEEPRSIRIGREKDHEEQRVERKVDRVQVDLEE